MSVVVVVVGVEIDVMDENIASVVLSSLAFLMSGPATFSSCGVVESEPPSACFLMGLSLQTIAGTHAVHIIFVG